MRVQLRHRLGYLTALLVALALPQVIYPGLALDIVVWGLFAVSLDLLLGFGGLLSFGHAAFWGSAGYAAGLAAKHLGVPFPVAVLAGVTVAVLLALPIGYLSIRRQAIYFAMVTLAFAQMLFYVTNEWRGLTGGENGLQAIPRTFPGLTLPSGSAAFYYAALPLALLGYWLAWRAVHSPFGHVLVAIRDNEARAQALGYPTRRYKVLGFVLSAALAGLAGSLFALGHGFAALELLHWTTSGLVVMMVILGGVGTLWGSVIGAAVVLLLRDWLSTSTLTLAGVSLKDAWGVVTGVIFVLIVLSFRRGVWGTLLQLRLPRGGSRPAPRAGQTTAGGPSAADGG
ncbi:MAG: Branched-chain amino acid transport system permease protein LivM [uncultured Thermomicrobiales bacterium]|uniref:Branched-chain amino acid transport system permease protein LivM n=1 Tax=uncultured Thermomicrobiales bacterium TaxID=1645740 RepID=A0A6J4VNM4_9BACT|nr:MAG: Branched-chain amino acid transport system permease protein LivM [uncultured Thermomicrobiales bacterium]